MMIERVVVLSIGHSNTQFSQFGSVVHNAQKRQNLASLFCRTCLMNMFDSLNHSYKFVVIEAVLRVHVSKRSPD